jgi:hypothetical protein
MQFLGSTWRRGTPPMTVPPVGPATTSPSKGCYATDGEGDGLADVGNPADATAGAARLLRTNGAPADYRRAILSYNHAEWYVDAVLAKAFESALPRRRTMREVRRLRNPGAMAHSGQNGPFE